MNDTSLGKQLYFLQNVIKDNLYVSVNTSKLGVILPEFLYDSGNVALYIGLFLENPLKELNVNYEGIRAILSFNRQPFKCSIPWSAVWLMQVEGSGDGCVWRDDAPREDVELQPEMGATGSDDPAPKHRDAYIGQLKPPSKPKPKRQLPPGWGGIVRETTDDKEPA